jgi:hypothetical protein
VLQDITEQVYGTREGERGREREGLGAVGEVEGYRDDQCE